MMLEMLSKSFGTEKRNYVLEIVICGRGRTWTTMPKPYIILLLCFGLEEMEEKERVDDKFRLGLVHNNRIREFDCTESR